MANVVRGGKRAKKSKGTFVGDMNAAAAPISSAKLEHVMQNLDRITRNPEVMGGKPCVRGMRVTVGTIVGLVAAGHSNTEILDAYPYLEEGHPSSPHIRRLARGGD